METMKYHLLWYGIKPKYLVWNRHGEIDEVIDEHHFMDSVSSSNPMNDYHTTIIDVVDHFFNENYEYGGEC